MPQNFRLYDYGQALQNFRLYDYAHVLQNFRLYDYGSQLQNCRSKEDSGGPLQNCKMIKILSLAQHLPASTKKNHEIM